MAHATGATSQAETIAIIPIFQLLHWAQKKRISSRDPPESTKTTWRKRAALLNLPTPNRSSSDFRWKSFAWVLVGPASAEEHWTFRCVQGELPRSNFAAPQNQVSKSETKVLEKQKEYWKAGLFVFTGSLHRSPSPVKQASRCVGSARSSGQWRMQHVRLFFRLERRRSMATRAPSCVQQTFNFWFCLRFCLVPKL